MHKKMLKKPDGRQLYLYSERPIPDGIMATNPEHAPLNARPHQRWHPLRREWVIFASHRQDRTFLPPKDFSPLAETKSLEFPTEMPAGDYDVAVFENLYPSMNLENFEPPSLSVETKPSRGICEVVVFTKNPETSLGELPRTKIELILKVLAERTSELAKIAAIQYVMPFENRGVEMGVTLHHPHGQIYSYDFVPPVQERMLESMKDYFAQTGQGLLEHIVVEEIKDGRRIVVESEHTIAFVPVFARYPYETWIVPKRSVALISELNADELKDLSFVIKALLMKFDRLWQRPFPYLMIFNQAPVKGEHPYAHFFIQITPPYRTKDRLKYLAGTELGAGVFVNDSIPEDKATELRSVSVEVSHD